MAHSDRIPRGIRNMACRIGPGRYMDPANGRIYVDSSDMDDFFEEMVDGTANADAKRLEEMEARKLIPRPPTALQDLAKQHLLNHAERLVQKAEDGGIAGGEGWKERANNRERHLLWRQQFKQGLGQELDAEDTQELADLAAVLRPAKKENEDDGIEGTTSGG